MTSSKGRQQKSRAAKHKPTLSYEVHEDTARAVLNAEYSHNDVPTIRMYEGKSYLWAAGEFKPLMKCELRAMIRNSLALGEVVATVPERDASGREVHDADGNVRYIKARVNYLPSIKRVNEVLDALAAISTMQSGRGTNFWISEHDVYKGSDMLPVRNGLLHLPSRELIPHTPNFFCQSVGAYDYDPSAKLEFGMKHLHEVYDGREDNIQTLFDWWGLILRPELDIHKILFRQGPARSGKGTEHHIISSIIGSDACVTPTLEAFDPSARAFGLEDMIGKRLASVAEATVSNRMDKNALAATLKSMSARDPQLVTRKGMMGVTMKSADVPRIQLNANDTASMRDSSGALGNRFVMIQTRVSFLGREDVERKNRIDMEGSGWLNEVLAGMDRVVSRGSIETAASSIHLLEAFKNRASPISAFVDECCELDSDAWVPKKDLFVVFKRYMHDVFGYKMEEVDITIEGNLLSAFPDVSIGRASASDDPGRPRVFRGIRLKGAYAPEKNADGTYRRNKGFLSRVA